MSYCPAADSIQYAAGPGRLASRLAAHAHNAAVIAPAEAGMQLAANDRRNNNSSSNHKGSSSNKPGTAQRSQWWPRESCQASAARCTGRGRVHMLPKCSMLAKPTTAPTSSCRVSTARSRMKRDTQACVHSAASRLACSELKCHHTAPHSASHLSGTNTAVGSTAGFLSTQVQPSPQISSAKCPSLT